MKSFLLTFVEINRKEIQNKKGEFIKHKIEKRTEIRVLENITLELFMTIANMTLLKKKRLNEERNTHTQIHDFDLFIRTIS